MQALADASGEELDKVRQAALVFLYRLLFVLYAEDRGLLPVNDVRYDDYGLRKRVRDDISRRMDEKDTFSSVAGNYYNRLIELFKIIDKGDPSIGLPPYNGGLFASDAAALLERVKLSDSQVAPIIYALSHTPRVRQGGLDTTDRSSGRRFVNYRDMSVQQLGSIYERLLERQPVSRRSRQDRRSGPIPTPARTAAASTRPRSLSISSSITRSSRSSRSAFRRSRRSPGSSRANAGPSPTGKPSCSRSIRPRRSSTSRSSTRRWAAATS